MNLYEKIQRVLRTQEKASDICCILRRLPTRCYWCEVHSGAGEALFTATCLRESKLLLQS